MNNTPKISFCIPLKNNLRYFKRCLNSIKKYADVPYEIVVYIDSDNDGTESFLIDNTIKYEKNKTNICKGIAHGYNRCALLSCSDVLLFFHADMILGPKSLSNAIKYLKEKTVVSLTRIEPPLHPQGKEKIVMDFGFWPEKNIENGFLENEFEEFVTNNLNTNKTTNGIFAPWMIYKKDMVDIGLHDELFHSYHEDSDIFNRFILSKYELIQSWSSMVYHLTCRGGQFQDGLSVTKDPIFHKMKKECADNYLRKWKSWIKNDEYNRPILKNVYNIGLVINNFNAELLNVFEPRFSTIYIDCMFDSYIEKNQSSTLIDLKSKIKKINNDKTNDVIVYFDFNKLTNANFEFITELLPDILDKQTENGTFEYDIFTFQINNLKQYQQDLIVNKNF